MLTLPEQKAFEVTPTGTHIAVCIKVIDLGTQIATYKQPDGSHKVNREVRIEWELPNKKMKDGRPFGVNKKYTLSSNEKSNLVTDVNAWRGRPFTPAEFGAFDLSKLLGKGCMLQVVHKDVAGKIYSNVKGVMALPEGTTVPPPENPLVKFDLSNFDQTVFDGLSDYLKKIISSSPEYKEIHGDEQPSNAESADYEQDAIPF